MKGAAADRVLTEELRLPVTAPVIYVASDPPGRSQVFVQRACGFQPGCAAALPDAEPEWQPQQALDAVADGRCAALALCGALSGTAESWVRMTSQLPADVLLLHSVLGREMGLGPEPVSEPEAEGESQYEDSDEGGLAIVAGLLGEVDVLWTDVAGLVALFDNELSTPDAANIRDTCVCV